MRPQFAAYGRALSKSCMSFVSKASIEDGIVERYGLQREVVPVEHEWGEPVDVERVLAAHDAPAIIAAVHAETSTGVRSDIAALGAGKGDALLVADAVTSIGGIELRADDWGIDVGYAGTQKCLGVAPGLAPFTINDRAFERRVEKPQSWYLDLGLLGGYVGDRRALRELEGAQERRDGPAVGRRDLRGVVHHRAEAVGLDVEEVADRRGAQPAADRAKA